MLSPPTCAASSRRRRRLTGGESARVPALLGRSEILVCVAAERRDRGNLEREDPRDAAQGRGPDQRRTRLRLCRKPHLLGRLLWLTNTLSISRLKNILS